MESWIHHHHRVIIFSLNDLCYQTAVKAIVRYNGKQHTLQHSTWRSVVLSLKEAEIRQHWTGLRTNLIFTHRSLSHSVQRNVAVGEDILHFTVEARLQVLPTNIS